MSGAGCLGQLTPLDAQTTASPDKVLFESRGTVLVLGDDAGIAAMAKAVAREHRTVVFAPGLDEQQFGSHVTAVARRVTAVRGHLGAFQAEIMTTSGAADIGAASPNPGRLFDIVLDLCRAPLISLAVLPLGYFAPGLDQAARARAILSIRGLVGRFTKPRYFGYQSELCAHGASGLHGCTRCLDVCSAQAISSVGAVIRVDPHLCQGCATCTLGCPTGALSFRFPAREALAERLRQSLGGVGTPDPILVVHSDALDTTVEQALVRHGALSIQVNPLPAFGDELWLRAFAMGARSLALIDPGSMSVKSRDMMDARVVQVRLMLPVLGIMPERLAWLGQDRLVQWLDAQRASRAVATATTNLSGPAVAMPAASRMPPAAQAPRSRFKRLEWLDAIRALAASDGVNATVALPVDAPFGEVRVNTRRCTLCFACTQLCPTGALVADNAKTQRLLFRESMCVQCGLCEQGCPEKAVSLHARFALPAIVGVVAAVLHQDEQQACKSCGAPFISRRLLASSLQRLKDHPVLGKGGREALLNCPACRQRDMLSHA